MTSPLVQDKVWLDKNKYDEAERLYFEKLSKGSSNTPPKNSLAGEVAKARQHIKHSLECMDNVAALTGNANIDLVARVVNLEKENEELKQRFLSMVQEIEKQVNSRFEKLCRELGVSLDKIQDPKAEDDGDDAEEKHKAVIEEYNKRKMKKPALIAKSNIILDVKPWDDETNMQELEAQVRAVSCPGLLWGASKLVPLAYGIHKLQISCVVEDELVSVDWLQETLQGIEDLVQSVDIAAFNKV